MNNPTFIYNGFPVMQAISYIKYFFYLWSKWDLPIAWHIIRNEIRGEKKYGISSTGVDQLETLEERGIDTRHATNYMPASYDLLELFFEKIQPLKISDLLDIGSGKGRVLSVAARYGFTELTGVDFSKELCLVAKENLARVQEQIPGISYNIINNDAFYFEIPVSTNCIFLFHPFDKIILSGVIHNIQKSLEEKPRELHIIYFNPVHLELFTNAGYTTIFNYRARHYLDGCIIKKR